MQLTRHKIYQSIYDAMQECEKLPASEQETKTVIAIGEIQKPADVLVEALEKIADFDGESIWNDDRDDAADAILEIARKALGRK